MEYVRVYTSIQFWGCLAPRPLFSLLYWVSPTREKTVWVRTENCIVFATTGHARFEHARVLNNKMRAIQGFGIC